MPVDRSIDRRIPADAVLLAAAFVGDMQAFMGGRARSQTSLVRVAVRIKNSNASLADKLLSEARMAWMNADTLS